MPQPANTPIAPSKRSGTWPDVSSASQQHSRKWRCCGSMIARVARADAEEPGVEHLDVVEHAGAAHVVGVGERRARARRRPRSSSRVEVDEAVVAGGDASPELVDVGRAGEAPGHADDGDVGVGGFRRRRRSSSLIARRLAAHRDRAAASARRRIAPRSAPVGAAERPARLVGSSASPAARRGGRRTSARSGSGRRR